MTLCTHVAIGHPYNVREVFDFCRTLLNTPADAATGTGPDKPEADGRKWMANPCGIGLDAWLWVYYGADGPMRHVCKSWCDDDCDDVNGDDPLENGWAAIDVSFDTAYGYRTDDGEGCSDLHARLVRALGQWLDAKGLPWKWQNEFTGEWSDRFDNLDAFGDAFKATGAESWFRDVVGLAGNAPEPSWAEERLLI